MDGALPREPALSTLLNGEIAKAYKEVCPGFNGGSLSTFLDPLLKMPLVMETQSSVQK